MCSLSHNPIGTRTVFSTHIYICSFRANSHNDDVRADRRTTANQSIKTVVRGKIDVTPKKDHILICATGVFDSDAYVVGVRLSNGVADESFGKSLSTVALGWGRLTRSYQH